MSTLRIALEPDATEDAKQIIRDHLDVYNIAVTGQQEYYPVAVFLKDSNDASLGGLVGDMWGGWLHVKFLWVAGPFRSRGHGRALLETAERYAVERGCGNVCLETFSFQAPGFYKKLDYEVFGTLEDYPPGHTKYFLSKRATG